MPDEVGVRTNKRRRYPGVRARICLSADDRSRGVRATPTPLQWPGDREITQERRTT
jgi:hypothetical protein